MFHTDDRKMNKLWLLFMAKLNAMDDANFYGRACKKIKENVCTDEERILFMMDLCEILNFEYTLHNKDSKNVRRSEQLREDGNTLYTTHFPTSEKCLEAFNLYCNSVAYAPIGSVQQAMAYGSRSAVLCRMGKYAECMMDIERAFSLDYPVALRSKLYLRKIICLAALKDSDLDNAIDTAKCWLNQTSMNDSDRTKFNDKINRLVKVARSKANTKENIESVPLVTHLPKIQNPNPEAPCASNTVAIKYNQKYGRHLVVTRDINQGEVLIVERPYVMLLAQDNVETHCHYCLEVCWAALPCDSCTYAMHCSKVCKSANWNASHDIECPILPTLLYYSFKETELLTLKLTILAIRRSGGIANLKTIMKEVNETKNMRTKGFSKDGLYESDQYRSIYSLITNIEKHSGSNILRMTFKAFMMTRFLLLCPNQTLIPKGDKDTFLFIGGLMLRHQPMIHCNANVHQEGTQVAHISFVQKRSAALMPFISLMNHACDNHIFKQSLFGHDIIYSLCPIEKGQQIMNNYGENYRVSSKKMRQKYLLDYHFFFCDCIPCREDWLVSKYIKSYAVSVTNSAKRIAIAKILNEIYQHISHSNKSPYLPNTNASRSLENVVSLLFRIAPRPCLEIVGLIEILMCRYVNKGNRFDLPQITPGTSSD